MRNCCKNTNESEEMEMKKGLTEIVFILDRSGSMAGLEADTIGGYNSMISKQKSEEGEALVSTVLFDGETEVLHDRVPLDTIEPITNKEYYVLGSTALLDAVGGAIHHIGNIHKYARPEDVPEKTLFIITTDGMENSSRQYTYDKVKKMVERQKEVPLGVHLPGCKHRCRKRCGQVRRRQVPRRQIRV